MGYNKYILHLFTYLFIGWFILMPQVNDLLIPTELQEYLEELEIEEEELKEKSGETEAMKLERLKELQTKRTEIAQNGELQRGTLEIKNKIDLEKDQPRKSIQTQQRIII